MTEITLKVLPVPEATGTISIRGLDAVAGVAALAAGLGSPYSVSGAAYLPAQRTAALRIEDFANSVKYRCEKLARELVESFGPAEILDSADSRIFWREIRDCKMLAPGEAIWRVSVPPSAGPGILGVAETLGVTGFLDWGGGLVWLSGAASELIHDGICAAVAAAGGVWWLCKAPVAMRAAVEVVPPEPPALAKIARRVRESFDPRGILNPGRLRAA
jgi:glycolate oxidase FAD binding subunit